MPSSIDRIFALQLLLSFVTGGCWVAFATLIADRFGSRVGGMVGGLPSTIIVALLFIGITQSPHAAADAAAIVPLANTANIFFMASFVVFASWGLRAALAGGFVVWFVIEAAIHALKLSGLFLGVIAWMIGVIVSYFIFERLLRVRSNSQRSLRIDIRQLAMRALISGSVIAFVVLLTKLGGTSLGGIFACFPAVFTATLIVATRTRGIDFAVSLTKPLILTGMLNVVPYALVVYFAYPAWGVWQGTLISLCSGFAIGTVTYRTVISKLS